MRTTRASAATVTGVVFVTALAVLTLIFPTEARLRAQGSFFGFGRTRVSPHERVDAVVGPARIAIVYGRPSMRGRTVFGGIVPYGNVWCPGADEATTLDSTRELLIDGLRVPPGPHTIWMLPTETRWTLIVSQEPSGFHTRYHPRADLGRVPLTLRALAAPVEQLTFAITPGAVTMSWARTEVSARFTVVQ